MVLYARGGARFKQGHKPAAHEADPLHILQVKGLGIGLGLAAIRGLEGPPRDESLHGGVGREVVLPADAALVTTVGARRQDRVLEGQSVLLVVALAEAE